MLRQKATSEQKVAQETNWVVAASTILASAPNRFWARDGAAVHGVGYTGLLLYSYTSAAVKIEWEKDFGQAQKVQPKHSVAPKSLTHRDLSVISFWNFDITILLLHIDIMISSVPRLS